MVLRLFPFLGSLAWIKPGGRKNAIEIAAGRRLPQEGPGGARQKRATGPRWCLQTRTEGKAAVLAQGVPSP